MIYELNHFGIVVKDLEKSVAFYQDVLGAKVVFQSVIPSSQTDILYLQIAGGMIELLHRATPNPEEGFGATHIAFLTDDLDADFSRLVAAGVKPLVEPKTAGSGVGRVAFVEDPNGARVELIERDVKMREGVIDHPYVKSFDHFSLAAADQDAARHFYGELLGMDQLTVMEVPATELTITYLNYGYDVLELLYRPNPAPDTPIFAHIALRVPNVDETLAAFAKLGVEPEPGTPKVTGTGIGRMGIIRDPDGFKIELLDRVDLRDLPAT
jgi:catechol 2,3-dioxygenase-like lactoylglutathione lyase family enzyme